MQKLNKGNNANALLFPKGSSPTSPLTLDDVKKDFANSESSTRAALLSVASSRRGSNFVDEEQEEDHHDVWSGVSCHLESVELWTKFHDLGTEMIITKTGR